MTYWLTPCCLKQHYKSLFCPSCPCYHLHLPPAISETCFQISFSRSLFPGVLWPPLLHSSSISSWSTALHNSLLALFHPATVRLQSLQHPLEALVLTTLPRMWTLGLIDRIICQCNSMNCLSSLSQFWSYFCTLRCLRISQKSTHLANNVKCLFKVNNANT